MDVPRIFISHSSKDAQLTKAVCERLCPADRGGGYQVLVDAEDLAASMEWPRYLLEWMARCHAAVILLTENAAASPWVLKEATILTARHSLDPSFKLFVVRFPNTDSLLEQRGYGPLMLSMIQQVRGADADSIAAAVRKELGDPRSGDTPFDALVGRLGDVLERVGDNALKTVARKLNVIPARLTITQTERSQHIETIARHLVCGELGTFTGVDELIDDLNTSTAEVARNILRLVSPYWIEPDAAGRLPRLLMSSPRRAAALNGARVASFTGPLYVRRAHGPSLRHQVIPISGGSHDKLVDHVTQEICAFMKKRRKNVSATTEEVIAEMKSDRPRWYAILPPPVPDSEALQELLDRFSTVTFILWTGHTLIRDPTLEPVEWLEPEVDLAREQREHTAYLAAEDVLAEMSA